MLRGNPAVAESALKCSPMAAAPKCLGLQCQILVNHSPFSSTISCFGLAMKLPSPSQTQCCHVPTTTDPLPRTHHHPKPVTHTALWEPLQSNTAPIGESPHPPFLLETRRLQRHTDTQLTLSLPRIQCPKALRPPPPTSSLSTPLNAKVCLLSFLLP